MSIGSRIIIAVASLSLIATFFLPFWFIFLIAPQYPEGLTMYIWLNKITGQVEIINGLNHYIGMKHIKAEMFPEFSYLIYVVGFFILVGLVTAISGKRNLLSAFLLLLIAGGIAAMYDFYKWGYDYGHNLDPKAAIQVPGLYYQPPLVGHKTLLNFDAYSYPDAGGWIVIVAGLLLVSVWIFEWRKSRKTAVKNNTPAKKPALAMAAFFMALMLNSCTTKPEPFSYGKDMCNDCKMTIMEPHFGGEIITKKGKVFKFDDAHCLAHFLKGGTVKEEDISQTVFVNYNKDGDFIDAANAVFVQSPQLKSPMTSNAAAFANTTEAEKKATEVSGKTMDWKTLQTTL